MSKIHHLTIWIAAVMFAINASAAHVTPQQALQRVNEMSSNRMSALKKATTSQYELTQTVGQLYVFNSKDGFMLLPADDRAPALLGYSDSGPLVIEGNSPLAEWLNFYNKELQAVQMLPASSAAESRSRQPSRTSREAISPLLKTEWNQESPYNMLCPKVNGHDVVTGCVATAMAQFMKYYDYPAKGHGTHSYYWEVGKDTLKLDYDTIPFQWNLMTDTYNSSSSEEAKKAVAELMLACGISVDMHYDIGDSGAATTHMGVSLINIFDYSPSLWMAHREFYGYDEWVGMVYDELAQGNPVLYSGQGTAGGHQFICDGFQGDGYFHFNWGWGGLSNGYFLLTALNPDDLGVGGGAGGFNTDQVATFNGRPPKTGDEPTYLMYNTEEFTPDTTEVKIGDDLRCGGIYFNFSMSALPEGSKLGMKFTNVDTKAAEYAQGPTVAGLKLDEGRYNDVVKFPELADGTYYITPALHAGGKWSEVKMPLGEPDRITAVVKDGIAALTVEQEAVIEIKEIEIPDTIYAAHDCPLMFSAYNSGNLEYYAKVTPYLINSQGETVGFSTYRPMDVLPGESESVNDYVANFSAESGETLSDGEYSLVFRDAAGDDISAPTSVYIATTTASTVIKVDDFKLETESPISDPSKVDFGFTLSCESGVYYNCPSVLIFPGDGGYEQEGVKGENHYLTAGQSLPVTVTGDLSELKDGNYMAAVYDNGSQQSDLVHFQIKRVTSAIDTTPLSDSGLFTNEPIYNLQGIRCTPPLTPGYYIVGSRIVVIK